MEHRRLDSSDHRFRKGLSEDPLQMFHYSIFRPLRCFPFRQNVKSKLTIEYFVFDLLEIQKIDRLLLKLIHARVAPFGCWLHLLPLPVPIVTLPVAIIPGRYVGNTSAG